jgi:hypothetical protein
MKFSAIISYLLVGLLQIQAFYFSKSTLSNKLSIRKAIKWDDITTRQNTDDPVREMISRAGMDIPSMFLTFTIQGVLLNAVILGSLIFNVDVTHFETSSSLFNINALKIVLVETSSLLGMQFTQ